MVPIKKGTPKLVRFNFKLPGARRVYLAGDFTNWEKGAIMMTGGGRVGEWVCETEITPGEHQYKFIADGNWYTDPNAAYQTWNNLGSQNSVIKVS